MDNRKVRKGRHENQWAISKLPQASVQSGTRCEAIDMEMINDSF